MSKRLKMQSKRRLGASEPDVSATKDDTRIKIVHARDEYDLPLKDGFSTVAPDAHSKNSKDVKSTESEERVTNSERKDKDIKKGTFNLDNTRTGKRKDKFENSKGDADNSEQRTDDGRPMKLRESKRAKRSFDGDRSQKKQVLPPSDQAKNASDEGRASNQERKYQIHNTHNIKQTEP
ncbi:hypothetical protein ACFX1S_019785 [Malus domestica]